MSKAEWKPGDVAMVSGSVAIRTDDNRSWWTPSGRIADHDGNPRLARPLVVIDPENREQVERLLSTYHAQYPVAWSSNADAIHADHMQAALREFANHTPPKPDEPTGLGAVVEDADGHHWVRVDTDPSITTGSWAAAAEPVLAARLWRNVNAVRVLSEGVTA